MQGDHTDLHWSSIAAVSRSESDSETVTSTAHPSTVDSRWILAIGGNDEVGRRWIERLGRAAQRDSGSSLCWAPGPAVSSTPVMPCIEETTASGILLKVWDTASPDSQRLRSRPLRWVTIQLDRMSHSIERTSPARRIVSAILRRSAHNLRRISQLSDGRVLWRSIRPMVAAINDDSLPSCIYLFDDDALCTGYHLARLWPDVRFADEDSATSTK